MPGDDEREELSLPSRPAPGGNDASPGSSPGKGASTPARASPGAGSAVSYGSGPVPLLPPKVSPRQRCCRSCLCSLAGITACVVCVAVLLAGFLCNRFNMATECESITKPKVFLPVRPNRPPTVSMFCATKAEDGSGLRSCAWWWPCS